MFGISLQELILVGVVALVVLGPERLPKAARELGKFLGGLRRQTDALRREFYNSVYTPVDEIKREIKRDLVIAENRPETAAAPAGEQPPEEKPAEEKPPTKEEPGGK